MFWKLLNFRLFSVRNAFIVFVILMPFFQMFLSFGFSSLAESSINENEFYRESFSRLGSRTIYVPDNFTTIQEAINNASDGDIIFVRNGNYSENVVVNKTVSLIGEDALHTILDGEGTSLLILSIVKSNVMIGNLTVKNTVSDREAYGIMVESSENVSLKNVIVTESYMGIILQNSSFCKLIDNAIVSNYAYGIYLRGGSTNNTFTGNSLSHNMKGIHIDSGCGGNLFHHNNFIENENNLELIITGGKWDNGTAGNYWSNYNGSDTDNDGVGDEYLPWEGVDSYPLMKPYIPPVHLLIPPYAVFTYSPIYPIINDPITFNASNSYDLGGHIIDYTWNFGDENITSTNVSTITHTYMNFGNYTVTLTVTDNDGQNDSITKVISVHPLTPPIAAFSYSPENPSIGETITFNASNSYDSDGNITMFTWDFGDGTVLKKPTSKGGYLATHVYEEIGNYTVKLTVTDDDGLNGTITKVLNVQKRKSSIILNIIPQHVTIGNNVTISGYITPAPKISVNVTIYYYTYVMETWEHIANVTTTRQGNFTYVWTTTKAGTYVFIKASWPGDNETLGNETIKVITVEKIASSITVDVNPENVTLGSYVNISGRISPKRANVNVTIKISLRNDGDSSENATVTVETDSEGYYWHTWKPPEVGVYEISVSWNGDENTEAAESELILVNVAEPQSILIPLIWLALLGLAALVTFLVLRYKSK